jgi:hypothetical protein
MSFVLSSTDGTFKHRFLFPITLAADGTFELHGLLAQFKSICAAAVSQSSKTDMQLSWKCA